MQRARIVTGGIQGDECPADSQGGKIGSQVCRHLRERQVCGMEETGASRIHVDAYGEGPTETVTPQNPSGCRPFMPMRRTNPDRRAHSLGLPTARRGTKEEPDTQDGKGPLGGLR